MSVPESIIKDYKRILVIGDIHADYHMMLKLLQQFKVIDRNGRWTAKDTYIVQLGDQVDGGGRGGSDAEGEQEVMEFMDNLNTQANEYGGAVYSLIGNHEIMNVMGDFRYASSADVKTDGGVTNRKHKYSPGGILAKRLAYSRNAIIKIGDIVFVHGGIAKELSSDIETDQGIRLINTTLREFLTNKIDSENPDVKRLFMEKNSLFWDRSLGKEDVKCDEISYIKHGHIIVGHTPQKAINAKCDGRIWRTDVGLSKAFGGNQHQVLEITKPPDGTPKFNVLT
jgi:hypothetical protein